MEKRYTIFALLTQLALDGKPDVEVSYHTVSRPDAVGGASLQRFNIAQNRQKDWVCNKPRSDVGTLMWHQLARCCIATNIPNSHVTIAWECKLNGKLLSFDRPFLVWSKAFTFKKDQYFRFA